MNAKLIFLAFAAVVCQANGQFSFFGNRPSGFQPSFFPNFFSQMFRPFQQQQQQNPLVIPTPLGEFVYRPRPVQMPSMPQMPQMPPFRPPFVPVFSSEEYPESYEQQPESEEFAEYPESYEQQPESEGFAEFPYNSEELQQPIYRPNSEEIQQPIYQLNSEELQQPSFPIDEIQISPQHPGEEEIYPGEEIAEGFEEEPVSSENEAQAQSEAQSEAHSETEAEVQAEVQVPEELVGDALEELEPEQEVIVHEETPSLGLPLV